jgi:hypothetical protein
MRKSVLAAFGLACGLVLSPAFAQNLQMADAPSAQARPETPTRGMSKAQVEQKFGTPSERVAAVGKPPISSWVYPGFIVYFEYDLVLHAVVTTPAAKP